MERCCGWLLRRASRDGETSDEWERKRMILPWFPVAVVMFVFNSVRSVRGCVEWLDAGGGDARPPLKPFTIGHLSSWVGAPLFAGYG
eukprot:gene28830-48853_t